MQIQQECPEAEDCPSMALGTSRTCPSPVPPWPTSLAQRCWPDHQSSTSAGCPMATPLPSSTRAAPRSSPPVLPPLLPHPTHPGDPHPGQPAETPDSCLIYLFVSPAKKKRMLRESKPANYTPSRPHKHVFYYHHPPCFLLPPRQLGEPSPALPCMRDTEGCIAAGPIPWPHPCR